MTQSENQRMKVVRMSKPIPDSEADRSEEAKQLIAKLRPEDVPNLTTWEVELVKELAEGKAATRIRLKELREAVERIHPTP